MLPKGKRDYIEKRLRCLDQHAPPLEPRDVVGLLALHLANALLIKGSVPTPDDNRQRVFEALVLIGIVATERMDAAGYLPNTDLVATWGEWYREAAVPYRDPRTARERAVRKIAEDWCIREIHGAADVAGEHAVTLRAAERARRLLVRWIQSRKRSKRSGANLDAEDILQDVDAAAQGEIARANFYRVNAESGRLEPRPEALRNLVRDALKRYGSDSAPDLNVYEAAAATLRAADEDPQAIAENAEIARRRLEAIERLRPTLDPRNRAILDNLDASNAALASMLSISESATSQRLAKLRAAIDREAGLG